MTKQEQKLGNQCMYVEEYQCTEQPKFACRIAKCGEQRILVMCRKHALIHARHEHGQRSIREYDNLKIFEWLN
mgnify:CR=1 FL=1